MATRICDKLCREGGRADRQYLCDSSGQPIRALQSAYRRLGRVMGAPFPDLMGDQIIADLDVLVGPAGVCRDEHIDDRSVRAFCAPVTLTGIAGTVRADACCLLIALSLQLIRKALVAGRSRRQPKVGITGSAVGICS